MQKVSSADFSMQSTEATLDAGLPSLPGASVEIGEIGERGAGVARRLRGFVSRLTDTQLALALSAVLFLVGAWPLVLTEVPPYQDLPNHLAAVTIIQNPARYPEFVFNGFLKTNAALFTWLYFVGNVIGIKVAARVFALCVLALNALVLPRFVLEMTGSRKKLVIASFFMWPMVHNWFVSMGMLDFALGVPLSLLILVLLNKQRRAPSWTTGLLVTLVAALTWYAHVFTLMVVHLLVLIEIVIATSWSERRRLAKVLLVPLVPVTALVLVSFYSHVTEPVGEMTGYVDSAKLLPPWELAYNMFAEWFYGFTWLSIGALVPCLALGALGLARRDERVPFFSPWALAVLGAFFVLTPYIATNWFHVNSRFIPFLWMAFLVRVPERLPKLLKGALVLAAATYTAGMGVDFVRLDADRAKFTAGLAAVPEGSHLLPLVFSRKLTSENTRSLQHTWGFYVMEKQTSAPLLFAHSRSFPVMYKQPPPPQFNHLVLESFAPSMGRPNWMCDVLRSGGVYVSDCEAAWKERWAEFWRQALPEYDHVLTWDATPEARALVPPQYRVVFSQDRLTIYERVDSKVTASRE